MRMGLLLLLAVVGCLPSFPVDPDGDGDGFPSDVDCDDENDSIYPGAEETWYDGVDSDCAGGSDFDADGDGHDAADFEGTDCDDSDPAIHPGAQDNPADGVDQDCDGHDRCSDFNCDGWPDVVLLNSYNGSTFNLDSFIYLGGPDGIDPDHRYQFATYGARRAAVGHLNDDPYLDLVVANSVDSDGFLAVGASVFYGKEGALKDPVTVGDASVGDVEIVDLDNDGHLDLVLANTVDSEGAHTVKSEVHWGTTSGPETARSTGFSTSAALEVLPWDLDQDGHLDLLFCGGHNSLVATVPWMIFWGDGSRSFSDAQEEETVQCRGLAVADLNNDGLQDVALAQFHIGTTTSNALVYYASTTNDGVSFGNPENLNAPAATSLGAAIGDLNEDGYPDLVIANYEDSSGSGNTQLQSQVYWGSDSEDGYDPANRTEFETYGAMNVRIADTDLDGHLDLLVANHLSHSGTGSFNYDLHSRIYLGPLYPNEEWESIELLGAGAKDILVIGPQEPGTGQAGSSRSGPVP